MSIDQYLTHMVDVVSVTMSKGQRSESTTEDVPCFITSRHHVIHDVRGDHLEVKTILFFKPDAPISEGDEIIVDGQQRPIAPIRRARNAHGIHHLEVELQ